MVSQLNRWHLGRLVLSKEFLRRISSRLSKSIHLLLGSSRGLTSSNISVFLVGCSEGDRKNSPRKDITNTNSTSQNFDLNPNRPALKVFVEAALKISTHQGSKQVVE